MMIYDIYYWLIELTCDLTSNEGSLGFIIFNNFWLGRQGTAMLWVDKERREINEKARQNWQNHDKGRTLQWIESRYWNISFWPHTSWDSCFGPSRCSLDGFSRFCRRRWRECSCVSSERNGRVASTYLRSHWTRLRSGRSRGRMRHL